MDGVQPTLTDGVVVLRPWRDEDAERMPAGDDAEITRWLGTGRGSASPKEGHAADRRAVSFAVEVDGALAGSVEVRVKDDGIGDLSWALYSGHRGRGYGVRAVAMLVDYAFEELDLTRVEAYVNVANERAKRLATRAGLRREGVLRGRETLSGERHDSVVFARLHDDPPVSDPESFRALLNSFLPRKRAISQMLIRDPDDRVLMCQLTYKRDWDLPGGVVEVGESPQLAVSREVEEELGLQIKAGDLVLTDWLPPWGGWDDAVCLVFDGGVHRADVVDSIVEEVREIRQARFCTMAEVQEHATDFTARRVSAALANARGTGGTPYTESGR